MEKHFKAILIVLMILGFILGYMLGDISADTIHLGDGEPSVHDLLERVE